MTENNANLRVETPYVKKPCMLEVLRRDRLAFGIWELADMDALVSLCKKPGIADFGSSRYQDMTPEKAKAFIEEEKTRFSLSRTSKFGVYTADGCSLLGIAGIFEMDFPHAGCFEINYRFPREHWGKGIGSEAARAMIDYGFDVLSLERVFAVILKNNIRSARVAVNVGMSVEKDTLWRGQSAQLWSIVRN